MGVNQFVKTTLPGIGIEKTGPKPWLAAFTRKLTIKAVLPFGDMTTLIGLAGATLIAPP